MTQRNRISLIIGEPQRKNPRTGVEIADAGMAGHDYVKRCRPSPPAGTPVAVRPAG